MVALAVTGVPIDVLADRLGTTRGAFYKTLHDAQAPRAPSDQGLAVLADGGAALRLQRAVGDRPDRHAFTPACGWLLGSTRLWR